MTAAKRRQQLVEVGRQIFAEYGYDAATVEEIAAAANVSKPVVYEHFGGKEGLYAVVCDRELAYLGAEITESLRGEGSRRRIERAVMALLRYVEERTDGFRILVRESSTVGGSSYSTLLNDATASVTYILEEEFVARGFDPVTTAVYAQALVGMVSGTAQWWLDVRAPCKEEVAAHIVNLCFNGLSHLEPAPTLETGVLAEYNAPSSPEGDPAGRDLRPGPAQP
ncbi:TetR/AcrR family transcriptional regulator [Rhodococcus sp. IEGM 1408]|uniref:TetR/AcrR family transcriptional regulator n=1 Tax=Rhodococcus sp. IEGM 1408 TaxID=3082220 RepID=UPI002955B1E6|nr:TetR/AcrR family transcriptional regulator [Rhodococcus sp. IEGM 1408]MDV8001071.1 TetR/AcrR family transcriptional regulator [Rhodococcus sp. IEGM 1408]